MVNPDGIVLLTDRRLAARPLVDVVAAAVAGGVRWVVLRERDLPPTERYELAEQLRQVVRSVGGRLIVAGPDPLGGDAVHLSAADPLPADAGLADRGGLTGVALIGRSCHDSGEVARLSTEDYITLSPIFATATKPGYGPALGPRVAATLAGRRPWLALGGIDSPERVAACLAAGARGVAVLGAVMRADDPEAVVRRFVAAVTVRNGEPARTGPPPAVAA